MRWPHHRAFKGLCRRRSGSGHCLIFKNILPNLLIAILEQRDGAVVNNQGNKLKWIPRPLPCCNMNLFNPNGLSAGSGLCCGFGWPLASSFEGAGDFLGMGGVGGVGWRVRGAKRTLNAARRPPIGLHAFHTTAKAWPGLTPKTSKKNPKATKATSKQ